VPSGIEDSNSSGELTAITLLKCLYTFLYAVHKLLPPLSSLPTRSMGADFSIKEIIPTTCFRSQLPKFTSYQTLKFIKMLYCILYVFASYVILSLWKALKEFIKVLGNSLFYSRLVIPSSLSIQPDSLLSSEKQFRTPGDKINWQNHAILPVIQRTAISWLQPHVFWNILAKLSSFIGLHKRWFLIRT
jgi:hypothetical protein